MMRLAPALTIPTDRLVAAFSLPEPVASRLVALAESRGQTAWHAGAAAWLASELARLRMSYVDPDESPTAVELQLLGVLAVLADLRGEIILPRAAMGDVLHLDSHALAAAESWGSWRGSFRTRRVSATGSPRVTWFSLRRPWPAIEGAR